MTNIADLAYGATVLAVRFGERLRKVAKRQGVSLNEISRRTQIDRRGLARIVNGETESPGIALVAKIARALGVTVDELLEGVEFD